MTMTAALPISMIPGNSVIHRINPIAKLIWVVGYIVLAFATQNIIILGVMAVLAFVVGLVAGVVKPLLKAMIILIEFPLLLSIAVILGLLVTGPAERRP